MRSRTYAFIPWITATTATRNPTDTMIPSRVKNDRSLWLHAVWSAWRIASESGMALKLNGKRDTGNGRRAYRRHAFPVSRLFVPQRLYRIEARRFARGIDPEQESGDRGGAQGEDDGAERHVGGNGRGAGQHQRHEPAHDHADDPTHQRERRRFDQELPQDLAPRGAEGFAHADLPRALRDRDHHDRDDPDAPDHQADHRERDHQDPRYQGEAVDGLHVDVLRDRIEVVSLPRPQPARRPQR